MHRTRGAEHPARATGAAIFPLVTAKSRILVLVTANDATAREQNLKLYRENISRQAKTQ
jgi:hypothetical protein